MYEYKHVYLIKYDVTFLYIQVQKRVFNEPNITENYSLACKANVITGELHN